MVDRQMQHGNIVEVKTPNNWQVKAAFGTALIVGIVLLAWMYRWWVGGAGLVIVCLYARRLWIEIQNQIAINAADALLRDANVTHVTAGAGTAEAEQSSAEARADQARADAERAKAEADRARIAVRLHYFPKVGVLLFHPDGTYDLLRERRSLTAKDEAAQLAAENPEPEFRPSLLQVMIQPEVVYVIAGAQRSGKTWQAGHIADHWLSLGIQPRVAGPKADNPGYDWTGCNSTIADDKATIDRALRAIMKEAGDRQQLLKSERTPIPVILDDWIATLSISKRTAYEFMAQAATTMASAGMVVYFLMQGDTTAAFGLKDLGAMLKNNFMRLTIIPLPDPSGLVTPGRSRAELVYPNTTEAVPVDLIPGRPLCFPDPAAGAIEGQMAASIPSTPEARIRAALADDPGQGYGKLQEAGWGSRGGGKSEERKEIIDHARQEMGVSEPFPGRFQAVSGPEDKTLETGRNGPETAKNGPKRVETR